MHRSLRYLLPLALAVTAATAHAQIWTLKGANVSVGGTGQFSTILESNPNNTTLPGTTTIISNKTQDTTWSAGLVASMQFHPVTWAGIEVNYGYTHYQERYGFNYSGIAARQQVRVPTDWQEATAGYLVHPKHIPFQPYMVIGGGAIDFNPNAIDGYPGEQNSGTHQWRGAGLLEAGFDIPTRNKHLAFRVAGRSLYYRSPNYNTAAISTRSWRVTSEPTVSAGVRASNSGRKAKRCSKFCCTVFFFAHNNSFATPRPNRGSGDSRFVPEISPGFANDGQASDERASADRLRERLHSAPAFKRKTRQPLGRLRRLRVLCQRRKRSQSRPAFYMPAAMRISASLAARTAPCAHLRRRPQQRGHDERHCYQDLRCCAHA